MRIQRNFPQFAPTFVLLIAITAAAYAQQPQFGGKWSVTGGSSLSTNNFTFSHGTYTKLHNGSVIATGGTIFNFGDDLLRSVEIYNPLTGKWSIAEPMHYPRLRLDALLLPNGKLLVIGGFRPNASPLYVYAGPPEVYDPETGHWTVLPITGEDLGPKYTLIPRSLAGKGEVDVLVTVEGKAATPIKIKIK